MGVTIQDIAERAGVSRGTVDRALNDRGRINPEVAGRIKMLAEEMGYVHKPRKRQDPAKRKKKLGVVTQLADAAFMQEINRGIQTAKKELEELGIQVTVKERSSVDENEQLEAIEELIEQGVDGLAIMPVDSEKIREKLNWLVQEQNIPVVTFNSDIVGTRRCCFVGMDNRQSGKTAAGLLKMLTRENGKILIITGYFSSFLNNSRDAKEVERIVENAMMNISGINGIFIVSGGQEGIEKAFCKLGIEQRPYVVLYDLIPENEKLLREDTADFLIDQNGFEQGYRPLRILSEMLSSGEMPEKEYFYTGIDIKTKYNL